MLAIVIEAPGGPEVLRLREVPDPVFGAEEVLVAVASSGLNRADVMQRLGFYPYPGKPPMFDVPGLEFAGRVVAVGDRVTAWQPGDAVMGIVTGGGYATRLAVHERQVMGVPASLGLRDAGTIPEVWITAYDALVLQGGLRAGDVALVHAGASGVGTAAIQIATSIGARVVVTTSAGKLDRCGELGADLAVDRVNDDFVARVQDFTEGRGVDVVLDVVGGDYLDRNIAAAARHGRIVQVGTMAGAKSSISLGPVMTKRLRLIGTVLRSRPIEEKIAVTQRFAREVLPGLASGRLRSVIDSRFALADAPRAHERLESNETFGKVALDMAGLA